jgi:phosphatidate cytidylyltransferase
MLRTRLWMGAVLVALVLGVLTIDQWLAPWFPFLYVLVVALALIACFELLHLLPAGRRPPAWLCYGSVALVLTANWPAHLLPVRWGPWDPWHWIAGTLAAVVLSAFVVEMAAFRQSGESVVRLALAVWITAYLGLLPSFLAQLRWLDAWPGGVWAVALALFVPKLCDIGAYFTGRFLGRHRLTPALSPRKTWEGLAGGLLFAALVTVVVNRVGPGPLGGPVAALVFGLVVGAAGVLGDLAESLIKRDCGQKDASQVMPGFGGVLDVVDSIVFAAPVAYWWFAH